MSAAALAPARRIGRIDPAHAAMVLSVAMIGLGASTSSFTATRLAPTSAPPAQADIASAYGKLPIRFEANQGQSDSAVRFLVHTGGATVFLTPQEAVWSLPGAKDTAPAVVRVGLAGSNPAPAVVGANVLPGVTNYLIGNDPARWHTNVPSYGGVRYQSVYPGIDQVYHAGGTGMEYDFDVAPGADPSAIAITVAGAGRPTIDGSGNLVVAAGAGEIRQHAPSLYQQIGGERRAVDGRFAIRPDGTVGFVVGAYDHARPLVIDPTLAYSTFLGGSGDEAAAGIALDSSGNAYVTGNTMSTNFPVTAGSLQTTCSKCSTVSTAFVTKLNAAGSQEVYSTYLGGSTGTDNGNGIAVDGSGNAYVTGYTTATDFPTANGYKTICGTSGSSCSTSGVGDAFLAKLNPAGTAVLYGTYIGGSGVEQGFGVALASGGVAYVTGETRSSDFGTSDSGSSTPYQATYNGGPSDGFLTRIDTAQAGAPSLLYASYLGGTGEGHAQGLAVDPAAPTVAMVSGFTKATNFPTSAGAYQTGLGGGNRSGTLSKIDTTLGTSGLLYSTYVGGSNGDSSFSGVAVRSGIAYLTGNTTSTTYPVNGTSAAYQSTFGGDASNGDALVTDIDTTKSGAASLAYSTYLGGPGGDRGYGIAVDSSNKITVTGSASAGFPLVHQINSGGGVFASLIDPAAGTGGLLYSTFLGGGVGNGVAVDSSSPSNALVTGGTYDSTFPTTPGAFQTTHGVGTVAAQDAFVTKLGSGNPPSVSGLSPNTGPFTGGTTVVVTGSGFTGGTGTSAVSFGSVAAPFTVNSDTQITTTSPCPAPGNPSPCPDSALGTATASTVNVTVTTNGLTSATNGVQFVYGEGHFNFAASCAGCVVSGEASAVTLPGGKVLFTDTGHDSYADGVAVKGLNIFTSGTALNHQRTFTSADVGKRLSASQSTHPSKAIFAPGTTISSVTNANTVTLSTNAIDNGNPSSFSVSNTDTELYDPVADTWTATGLCKLCGESDPESGALTLTLLNTGKVLAAGGFDPTAVDQAYGAGGSIADAYLYDPSAGTWSPTKNTSTQAVTTMTAPRKGATAALLSTGKVLITGGSNTGLAATLTVDPMASAELYDPAAGTFTATASMGTARADASSAVLPNGNVLVAGGFVSGKNAPATATAEQYNPTAGTWSSTASMNTPRVYHSLTALGTTGCGNNCGKVLVNSGFPCYVAACVPPAGPSSTTSAELYTPSTNTWAYTASLSGGQRENPDATLLPNGRVLVSGGGPSVAERYDPAAGTWASAGVGGGSNSCFRCATVLSGSTSACATNCGRVFDTASFYTPRPVVSGVAPTSGAGFGGTTVTITGTGLASVTQVKFGSDMSGTATAVPDPTTPDTKLTAVAPGELGNGATGSTVDTTVTGPGGVSSISTADQYGYGTFGSLQVSTSPSLASQITVDNIYRDTTAVANLKIASGSHTVCFREVPGYLPVSCQNVTVTAGQTTTATGTFVQKGTLNASSNQPTGSIKVALHGQTVITRDDGSINTDLAVGSYDVCFGPVLNQNPPPCQQNVAVTAGQTTTVTGNYTSHLGSPGDDPTLGSIKVVTSPAGLGTQISVDSIPRNTGAIANLKIAAGSHSVCFREVTGYLPSACQNVTVTAALTTSVTGTFVAKGTLKVTETPSGTAGTSFVDGTPRDDGGMSTDLPVGTSQVCFGAVSGHVTPACRNVAITGGQTVSTTGAY